MDALDINDTIPIEKADLINSSKLATEFSVSREYVRSILVGRRSANTSIAKAIKEKAIKIIEAIENI